jgi:hypothetical protein
VSESNEYVTIAGLKVPQYAHGFLGIAFAVTYENFVVCLTELNPKTLTRPAAEQAWLEIVHQSYREWSPCPEEYTDQEKKDLRKKATAQVCCPLVSFKERVYMLIVGNRYMARG